MRWCVGGGVISWYGISRRASSSLSGLLFLLLQQLLTVGADNAAQGFVTELTSANINQVKDSAQVLFVAFCAEWCPYSRRLKPIFQESARAWHTAHPNTNVVWGTVDSDSQGDLSSNFGVEKYPTLKVFINGVLMPYEYRSSRTVEELNNFVAEQIKSNMREFSTLSVLDTEMNKDKRNIIAYYHCSDCAAYKNFQKVASFLRKDCEFWQASGDALRSSPPEPSITFREPDSGLEAKFSGNFDDYEYVKKWITDKCVPLVREVTFDNVEELTEENIPFLLFFRNPSDKESEKLFRDVVARELYDQRSLINPLLADGFKFAHPLKHLGKSASDLPVLAIDSFQHMFLFDDMRELPQPGKLRKFVMDLHSGDLHKNFHATLQKRMAELEAAAIKEMERVMNGEDSNGAKPPAILPRDTETTPPESVFKELKPSDKRYTLLDKQEL